MKWNHKTELKKMDEHLGSAAFKQYWNMNAAPPNAANRYGPLNLDPSYCYPNHPLLSCMCTLQTSGPGR